MPDKGDFGSSESHETLPGGERVLIRRARPEDAALYPDFLADVSAEDLRLRFFARVAELSAEESDKLRHLDYRHEMAFIALDKDTGQMLVLLRGYGPGFMPIEGRAQTSGRFLFYRRGMHAHEAGA